MSTARLPQPVRVLALWCPDWPVVAASAEAGVPADRPAAVFAANRVVACSALARAAGVRRGLRRREAQARCPELAVLAVDPARDARAFEPVVAAVEELAPGVEVVRPGLVALPAQGPVGYFGGEQPAAERLIDQVGARTTAECQVGVADGLFAATLAARRGLSVEPGRTPEFLAPLDVAELDREPEVDRAELISLLRRLGLRSLGAFAALPAADVASRFGADAVLAHRLARGLAPRPPAARQPPDELSVEVELDQPVDRVDAAAFASRALAEELHGVLAGHGLACTRLGIEACLVSVEGNEHELARVWRCAEPLTPAGTVDRVRWQLDAWLTRGGRGAIVRLRLVGAETVTAGALQLGLWGDVGESDTRAGRALVRVQAMLGPEAVCTAVLGGGRDPGERVRLVPWGDDRGEPSSAHPSSTQPNKTQPNKTQPSRSRSPESVSTDSAAAAADTAAGPSRPVIRPGRRRGVGRRRSRSRSTTSRSTASQIGPGREPPASWPGRLPAPSPATVPPEPIPARVLDADGRPLRVSDRHVLSAAPHTVAVDGGPPRPVLAWTGPWPLEARWWDPAERGRSCRFQVLLDDGAGTSTALLLANSTGPAGRWTVTAIYD